VTPDDDDLAKRIYAALMDSSLNSVRAKKQQGFQLGVSDLGFCSERIRRTLEPVDQSRMVAGRDKIGLTVSINVHDGSVNRPDAVAKHDWFPIRSNI